MALLRMTAHFLKATHPERCNDFRVFSRDPVFRGMSFGVDKFGITSEDLEREICDHILKIPRPSQQIARSEVQSSPRNSFKTRFDLGFGKCLAMNPYEIARLSVDQKAAVIDMWVSYELGVCDGLKQKFYASYSDAMETANKKALESINGE